MSKEKLFPDYIFESSWEVCNKVGGIYTVLSSRALTLQRLLGDHLIFIGPLFDAPNPYFEEDSQLYADWVAQEKELHMRVGRWKVPGRPVAILVDFRPFFARKNEIYTWLWELYQVDSLHAYGDYDEASMFSYAAGRVVESFYRYYKLDDSRVVYHGNEWMTGLGLLYINNKVRAIATLFTTHATSIGRSIAGNNNPLYQYLPEYNGNQMACELNMQSKHSIELQTAHHVDCFTTVSDITATECRELLDKPVDVVLPNGFEDDFVPTGAAYARKRKAARARLLDTANALMGTHLDDSTLIVSTSGRYEFRNKGIDVFIDAMNHLRHDSWLNRDVVAFIEVPGWMAGPRQDLQERLRAMEGGATFDTPLDNPRLTHWLHNTNDDRVLGMMNYLDMHNRPEDRVKLIFVPCYLTGSDGIIDLPYYDVVLGNDLCVYPSYYEPWGYTPLESVAFSVPCITTDLAGFGLWANKVRGTLSTIMDGVEVVHRTDYNYADVVAGVEDTVARYASLPASAVRSCRTRAHRLAKQALWSRFIAYYREAYDIALRRAEARCDQ
ncbi:MAG: glycogen/starch synthase [Prevotella sp.]|nr:glycogen/starch synthase [Prevotella sp.]MDY3247279.1 glycogen/starch synthase [Prevotella sp.]